eukprot:TRINITY_DN11212_c0_g1_i1.p1 TRINITY_DN11212_c0_g1~~TRINITY_DN11212_c0_g1_i1.p1  ORF type:complete len:629 (+),score=71.66 TRINITY_DN11212_c0_g1_i1:402-2288(+)
MQQLGFRFFHPFDPVIPSSLSRVLTKIIEQPKNQIRLHHYHTEHPLEMTEMLQGMRPFDNQRLTEWNLYLQWVVANRMTHVEWVLLCADSYKDFCYSAERTQRLRTLIDMAHNFSVQIFLDVAIAMQQQHAMHMIQDTDAPLQQQINDIKQAIQWITSCNVDGISTENGVSEFTHASCNVSLIWMNTLTENSPVPVYIKEHISSGQFCDGFKDPVTGGPLNFNFLPYYASKGLGVMPHTVQFYTVDDPAPTYGQTNFSFMLHSALYTASTGRNTLWFGETAYWVNYDIDVPLFLPLYGYRSLYDLRKVSKGDLTGTATFSSGFEFGYWLHDCMWASAAWNPLMQYPETYDALRVILKDILWSDEIVQWLMDVIKIQRNLLIFGGNPYQKDFVKKNGIAYIEGWDTWSEIGDLVGIVDTQPKKLGFLTFRFNPFHSPKYKQEVRPFLFNMTTRFQDLNSRIRGLEASTPPAFKRYANEFMLTWNITTQRTIQVFELYEYISTGNKSHWQEAERALNRAAEIMSQYSFRLPVERVASWNPSNPTSYNYMYLWTAKTLYYFWRDRAKVLLDSPIDLSPCLYNIINPVDVALGQGSLEELVEKLRELAHKNGWPEQFIADCLAAPKTEPKYP